LGLCGAVGHEQHVGVGFQFFAGLGEHGDQLQLPFGCGAVAVADVGVDVVFELEGE